MKVTLKNLIVEERKLKIARTTEHTDTVLVATPFVTTNKSLQGIEFKLKTLPYLIRVLTKDDPRLYAGSKVKFVGTMETYKNAQYFRAKDVELVEQSKQSMASLAGMNFSF